VKKWHRALAGVFALGAAAAAAFAVTDGTQTWLPARPDYAWSFPRDHWTHPGYRTEWWYLTGHLEDASERRYGYQLTFFRIGLLREPPPLASAWAATGLVMGHAAVTDLGAKEHRFSEVLIRAAPLLGGFGAFPDPRLAWSRAPAGTEGDWALRWNGDGFDLEMLDTATRFGLGLSTHAAKPLVLHGPNGFSRKGGSAAAASQYYSFTRLRTEGTLSLDGTTSAVRGTSWMDKEFSSSALEAQQTGWDWFSLQLDDGRELMLYLMRDAHGGVDFARGTMVASTGASRPLEAADWSLAATGRWRSPTSGAEYPAGWTLAVPSERLALTIRPLLSDQENRSARLPALFYWEGAVEVLAEGGKRVGQGYVELTGYGNAAKPAI
jgi:predicted secreted hydrolase